MGLTDRIFTRVESQEAAAVGRSQFMMDLCQVASMLRLATARCALFFRPSFRSFFSMHLGSCPPPVPGNEASKGGG